MDYPRVLGMLVLATSVSAGCTDRSDESASEAEEAPPVSEAAGTVRDSAALASANEVLASGRFARDTAAGANQGLEGSYELVRNPAGGSVLMVQLHGLVSGEHAWHIHAGGCAQTANVAVPLLPLSADESGDAVQTVAIADSAWRAQRGPFSIRVHQRAGTDPGAIVACAPLELKQ